MQSVRRMLPTFLLAVALVCALLSTSARAAEQAKAHEEFGSVNFPTSCKPAVQADFNRSVAILHSFQYESARSEFEKVAAADASCAMAHWGVAMTYWHPLWGPPGKDALEKGMAEAQKAESLHAGTARERGYIDSINAYYHEWQNYNPQQRAVAYSQAMEKVYKENPEDVEAQCFYALSLLGSALPSDTTYANQNKAGEILLKVFAAHPDHPGAAHYIIHSYDCPSLAAKALPAARRYALIAPGAAHARHMPSHIFTRLGLWQDSVNSNLASIDAAKHAMAHEEEGMGDAMHATDFLTYAYLQLGEYNAAEGIIPGLKHMPPSGMPGDSDSPDEKSTEVLVQIALEQHEWKRAAQIAVPDRVDDETKAVVYWANALGAAHLGDAAAAQKAVESLQSLYDHGLGEDRSGLGIHYGEMELEEARAWLAQAHGDSAKAVKVMTAIAAKVETGKAQGIIYPPVLPPREQAGELLLAQKNPQEALKQFEANLKDNPNRFDGLYGAAQAAELSGDTVAAKKYFAELVKLGEHADSGSMAMKQAKTFLEGK